MKFDCVPDKSGLTREVRRKALPAGGRAASGPGGARLAGAAPRRICGSRQVQIGLAAQALNSFVEIYRASDPN